MRHINEPDYCYDWASEVSYWMKNAILFGDHEYLINYHQLGEAFSLAIPSSEHFIPLIYVLGLQEKHDSIKLFNDKVIGGH